MKLGPGPYFLHLFHLLVPPFDFCRMLLLFICLSLCLAPSAASFPCLVTCCLLLAGCSQHPVSHANRTLKPTVVIRPQPTPELYWHPGVSCGPLAVDSIRSSQEASQRPQFRSSALHCVQLRTRGLTVSLLASSLCILLAPQKFHQSEG